jgi:hypothetical protein
MIIFANTSLDTDVNSSETFTALLLMAVASTMLKVPMVTPIRARTRHIATRAGPRRPLITPVTGKDLTPR